MTGLGHTAWSLLWHLAVCQEDILLYALNEGHVSPPTPRASGPGRPAPVKTSDWDGTVRKFNRDLAAIVRMVRDPGRDLYAPIRPGLDESLLQMAGLVIDHNSYHIGQLVDLRMLLGVPVKDW
ncbi:MAG: DinB family protein [Desulfobacterales bacterium]|nr:DinB family protein [Desulfobacterales bacterium]